MNNHNPFVPQGSILELQSKRRSRLKLAVFCVLAVSVASLAAMLIQGCKREQPADNVETQTIDTNTTPVVDTNTPTVDTNAVAMPPVVANPPVVTAPPPAAEYTVVKGDTLSGIAKKEVVSLKALEAANPNIVPTKMKIGDKLVIPAGAAAVTTTTDAAGVGSGTYKIKSGDTLTRIAHHFHTTVKAIEAANPGVDPNHIKVGKVLNIPGNAEAAAPAPAPTSPPPSATPAPTEPATTPGSTTGN